MYYEMISCPKCNSMIDTRVLGIYSGLGSPVMECGSCGQGFTSGRVEWRDFTVGKLIRFGLMSTIELAGLTFFAALACGIAVQFLTKGPWADKGLSLNGAYVGGGLFLALGIFIQIRRILSSQRRTSTNPAGWIRPSTLDLETGLQWKFCGICLGIGFLGWLISWLLWLVT